MTFKATGLSCLVIALGLAAAMSSGCATPAAKPAKLVFAVQSAKPEDTRAAWQPLVADLSKQLGVPVELMTVGQAETVAALASGKADLVWLSSSMAVDAVVDAKAKAFALYFNVNGTNGYKAVVATRAHSGIKTLDEALTPGKYRYATGAKTSTSGYVLPQHFLFSPRKTTAEALFKSVQVGGHFPNLDALWAKQVDVIITNSTDLAVFQARTPGAVTGIVTLWESPLVPNDVLMTRSDMPPATQKMLTDLFLNYGKAPEQKELFKKASGISHLVQANNLLLEPVSGFKFATERAQFEGNTSLNAEQKAAAISRLNQRAEQFAQSLRGLRLIAPP
jgi:phosphonate transport system substrate-binding protein